MAGFAIALALLVVGVVCVPLRLWASRVGSSLRGGRAVDGLDPEVPHDAMGLTGLMQVTRRLQVLAEVLRRVAPEYRRTLPYVSLFFADPRQGLHVRRDRWIVGVRREFEAVIERLAEALDAWSSIADGLEDRERALLDATGGSPIVLERLLGHLEGVHHDAAAARRWRFCEETELEELESLVEALAEDLRRLELELARRAATPYR